jgi:hypothetical protein
VEVLVVRTADFRLAYRLCDELRRRKINFEVLGEGERLPNINSVWMGTPEEVAIAREGRGVGVNTEAVELGVERALQFAMGFGRMRHLSFGIDPGPRPGLAWLADGVLIGTAQLERVDDVADHIKALTKVLVHDSLSVMIGDGVPTMRNRIINCCLVRKLPIHIVDERRTSHGIRRHHHHNAAIKIAQMEGKKITKRMPVSPTEGELREVQSRSRKTSQGRLTISSELAKAVAVGRLTMHEAIENQRLKNHKN